MSPTCSRCGGTTEFRLEQGTTVVVCLDCGLVRRGSGPVRSAGVPVPGRPRTGPESLGALLAADPQPPLWRGGPGAEPDAFDDDEVTRVDDATAELLLRDAPFPPEASAGRPFAWLGPVLVAAGSVSLVAGFALIAVAAVLVRSADNADGAAPSLAAATPPILAPLASPPPPPQVAAAPVAEAPEAPPAADDPTTANGWVERGWSVVGRDPGAGAEAFRRAIRLDAGDGEAAYGLGYALLSLDDVSGATPWLCQAAATVQDSDTRRDVAVLVKRHAIHCPG